MTLHFTCKCGKRLSADESLSGQKGKCPKCGVTFTVPPQVRAGSPAVPSDHESGHLPRACDLETHWTIHKHAGRGIGGGGAAIVLLLMVIRNIPPGIRGSPLLDVLQVGAALCAIGGAVLGWVGASKERNERRALSREIADQCRARNMPTVLCRRCGGTGLSGFSAACERCKGYGYHAAPTGIAEADAAAEVPADVSPLAWASLICGIASLVFCFMGALAGIPAVVTGHLALVAINRSDKRGRGLAIAGLVMGYIAIAVTCLAVLGLMLSRR